MFVNKPVAKCVLGDAFVYGFFMQIVGECW